MWSNLGPFINKYLGRANVGDTGPNMGQCVGLIEVWLDSLHTSHIPGNAVDLLGNAPALGYTVIRNNPMNFPLPGNIACWDGTWGGGYGHTAVVIAADVLQLLVLEQNDPEGAGVLVGLHDYSGVAGWIVVS